MKEGWSWNKWVLVHLIHISLKNYLWIRLLQLQRYLELDNPCCKFLIARCMGIFPIPRFLPLRISRFSGLWSDFSIKSTDSLTQIVSPESCLGNNYCYAIFCRTKHFLEMTNGFTQNNKSFHSGTFWLKIVFLILWICSVMRFK